MSDASMQQELETVLQLTRVLENQKQWLAQGDWTQSMPEADMAERLGKRLLSMRSKHASLIPSNELKEAVLALQEHYSALDHALRVAGSGLGEALTMLREQTGLVYGSAESTGRSLGSA